MAERRMFAKTIIDSDAFLDMPLSSQALYFHLSMRADDDGFINNPKKIQRMVGCGDDDLKLLIAKNFIIPFESGIVVIKHWKIHNYIQKDRYKPSVYSEEKAQLNVKDNKAYTLADIPCIPNGYISDTQVSLGKDSSDKESKDKPKKKSSKPDFDNILFSVEDEELKGLYLDYIEMRKNIKSPMTERALTLLINKVNELSKGVLTVKKQLLETAILNNWKSVYPIKGNEAPAVPTESFNKKWSV